MGASFEFTCPKCGYYWRGSEGIGIGMACAVMTVMCKDCRELHCIQITDTPWEVKDHPASYWLGRCECPKDTGHKVIRWKRSNPCPKCGEKMERGEDILMWD